MDGADRADDRRPPGLDGAVDHVDRAADDRRAVRCVRELRLGRHGVHRRRGDRDTGARQAVRPLRAAADLPGDDGPVHPRLAAVRPVAEHEPADRSPRRAGPRRRGDPGAGVRHPRRHPPAARAWPVHRLLHAGLRRRGAARPVDRWVHHRPMVVAVDLLHQHPARRRRRDRQLHRPRPAVPAARSPARHRRSGAAGDHDRVADDRARRGRPHRLDRAARASVCSSSC